MKKKNESGFTYIEAIVALFIIALASYSMYSLFSGTFSSMIKKKRLFKENVEFLNFYNLLSSNLMEIPNPYWGNSIKIKENNNKIILKYYDSADKVIEILRINNQIKYINDGEIFYFNINPQILFIKDRNNHATGLKIITKTGKEYFISLGERVIEGYI